MSAGGQRKNRDPSVLGLHVALRLIVIGWLSLSSCSHCQLAIIEPNPLMAGQVLLCDRRKSSDCKGLDLSCPLAAAKHISV